MKLFVFLIAALALVWLLRRSLGGGARAKPHEPQDRPGPEADAAGPQTMLACAQCGIHLPQNEALPGRGGVFCTEAHRGAYERAHPAP